MIRSVTGWVVCALKAAGWFVAAIVALAACYGLAGWAGSGISRNGDWVEAASTSADANAQPTADFATDGTVEILLETNGVHTALVMPLTTPIKDWRPNFPASDLPSGDEPFTHIALSWGEKEVFLNTPRWEDLRLSTVLNILQFKGEALLHAAHYVRPAPSKTLRPIRLSADEYARLVGFIEGYIVQGSPQPYPGYGAQDVFYNAHGTYTPLKTCNQWTSDALAAAGVRTGWWTPFAGGVMKWVSQPNDRLAPGF